MSPGSDSLQAAVQANPSVLNSALTSAAQGVEIRQLRKTANLAIVYHATSSTDLLFHLVNTMKDGEQPSAGTFGFSNAIEFPGPLDHRTTDITGQLQWSNERGTIRAGYDGSFFSNNIQTLVWDNPLRVQDGATGIGPARDAIRSGPTTRPTGYRRQRRGSSASRPGSSATCRSRMEPLLLPSRSIRRFRSFHWRGRPPTFRQT